MSRPIAAARPRTRRTLLGFAAVGVPALAACGVAGTGASPGSTGGTAAQPARISVIFSTAGTQPIQDKLDAGFHAAYPAVQLEQTGMQGTVDTPQKILTLAAAGTPPDVVPLHPAFVTDLAEKGLLADLQTFASKDKGVDLPDFYQGVLDHFRVKGVLHGLPWNSGPSITYFNRTLLQRLGVKPPDQREREGTWTWAAYEEIARAATQGTGDMRTMGSQAPSSALDWFDAWIWQAGGDVFNKDLTKCLLAEPPALQTGQYLTDLYLKDRAIPVGSETSEFPGGVESGRVALRIGNKDQATVLDQKATAGNFTVGMAPTPKGAGGRANRDGPQAYGVGKSTQAPDAAWAYVRYMSNLDTQKLRLAAKLTTPVRKSAAKTPEFAQSLLPWEVGDWWQEASATTRSFPKPTRYAEANKVWQAAWGTIIGGQAAVRATMGDVSRQIDALLAGG